MRCKTLIHKLAHTFTASLRHVQRELPSETALSGIAIVQYESVFDSVLTPVLFRYIRFDAALKSRQRYTLFAKDTD